MRTFLFFLVGIFARMMNFIVYVFGALFKSVNWKTELTVVGDVVSFITGKSIFDKKPCSATGGTA